MRTLPALALILAATLVQPGYGEGTEAKAERSKLTVLKEQISSLSQQLLQRNNEADKLANQLREQELELAKTNKQIASLDGEVAQLQSDVEALGERKAALEGQRRAQQEMIAKEVKSAYRLGNSEPVRLLLNQEDPQKLARIMKYYHYFAEARRQKLDAFAATLAELATVETDIASKQQTLLANREALVAQAAKLDGEKASRKELLASLTASLSSDKARLANLNKERKGLEDVIARLEQAIHTLGQNNSTPFASMRGKLPWPVAGKLSQSYGSRRTQGMTWSGWVIDASEGAPVQSVHRGRVVFSDYLRGHGLMIIVDHGGGFLSLYAHNQRLLKEDGDWVQAGEKIALAGNTGGLASSALYFEIRHNGKPQDPKSWISARR